MTTVDSECFEDLEDLFDIELEITPIIEVEEDEEMSEEKYENLVQDSFDHT